VDGERRRLEALAETGLLDEDPLPGLMRAANLVRTALEAPVALVTLVDRQRQFFAANAGTGPLWGPVRQTPLSHSYCRFVVGDDRPLVVDDAARHPVFRDHPGHTELSVVAYAGVPIRTRDGHVLGSLCAIDSQPRAWSPRDLAVLEDTVQWVGDEVDLRRELFRARSASQHLAVMNESLRLDQESAFASTRATLHDLRTPLTTLGVGLDQLALVVREQPVGQIVDLLQRNLAYVGSLIDGASGEMGVGPAATIDAARCTADVAARFSLHGDVDLDFTVLDEPAPVRFGRVLWQRCVTNLVDNALRFARSRVELTQHRDGPRVVTRVDDDGPGLPTLQDYARLGTPHLRLHALEGRSGSGLGLSIVARLLEEQGGHLGGEPSPLGGARVEMTLPIAA